MAENHSEPALGEPARPAPPQVGQATVACLASADGVDPATLLADESGVEVRTVVDDVADLDRVEGLDCVATGTREPDGGDAVDALSTLRERGQTVPFVLVATDLEAEPLTELLAAPRSDVVPAGPPAPGRRLAHRIRELVASHRNQLRAERATAAVEAARDGIAVITSDGSVALANRSFARQFGTVPDDLVGRRWQTLFADDDATRIESEALAAVADGWEWLGTCEGRYLDGQSAVRLQVRVAGAGDAFVLAVSRPQQRQGDGHRPTHVTPAEDGDSPVANTDTSTVYDSRSGTDLSSETDSSSGAGTPD